MSDQDLANVVNVFAIIFGMTVAVVLGYISGYYDGIKKGKNE